MHSTILLTGGLGYLGGRIADGLRGRHDLRLTTRRPMAHRPVWADEFDVVTLNFPNGDFERVCHMASAVVHLAALNAADCAADPGLAIEININGTRRLVEAAKRAGIARFIYISTAHVYGAPLVGDIHEELVTRPAHPYGWTHRAAEDIVLAAGGLETAVLRLSNIIGPPMDANANCWTLVANDLCRQAVMRKELVLRGTGLEQRDFIAMDDVVRCVAFLLSLPQGAWGDGRYNLGGGRSMPVRALASLNGARIMLILGYDTVLKHAPGDAPCPPLHFRIDKL